MNLPRDPQEPSQAEPITGEPLVAPPSVDNDRREPVERVEPIDQTEMLPEPPSTLAPTEQAGTSKGEGGQDAEQGSGSKVKAAALLAGAAALTNKVRQEAPKKVQQLREKRAAGRCVILTEANGEYLAIGPYKNEEAARQDIFKVGGTSHVVELRSETAFFAPPSQ